jgi:hypothetical protein
MVKCSRYVALAAVLLVATALLFLLRDTTLQGDAYEWLQTARTLHATGDTGYQYRNILYAYILAAPLALGLDPVAFGLVFSGLSLLISTALLYRIGLDYVSPTVAGFASLLFILSYPFLRYATQVFTDIPAVLFATAMIFLHFRFLKTQRPLDLWLGYVAASLAVSLRYATGFFIAAFVYYLWITRRHLKWHIVGVLLALIPYAPQLIYNLKYMAAPIAVSYTAEHPIFGIQFFFKDLGSGREFQLPGYLRYMFLDFRGLFVLLTPVAAFGAVRSFRVLRPPLATYLVLYLACFMLLLPFYSYFSNRYAIPALLPCFIWLPIGIAELLRLIERRAPAWRPWALLALVVIAYSMFEISFQVIDSSRRLHELRERVYTDLGEIIEERDAVYTLASLTDLARRLQSPRPRVFGVEELTPDLLDQWDDRNVYVVWTPQLATSEGGSWRLSIERVRDRLEVVYSARSGAGIELLLFRGLRLAGLGRLIPHEEWYIFRAKGAAAARSLPCV